MDDSSVCGVDEQAGVNYFLEISAIVKESEPSKCFRTAENFIIIFTFGVS
jgi:hypothetical protein